MKHLLITILFLSVALYSFGQDKANEQDTAILTVEAKHVNKDADYYKMVTPKQSEWKMVVPSNAKLLTNTDRDSAIYEFQKVEQVEWVDNSENAFTHEINTAKHSLATQRLTYNQVKYLLDLPYLR